jgi:MFS family permease
MTIDERAPSAPDSKPRLRDFWDDLPREGRFLLSIVVLEFLGTGLVLPFNVVYLHEVRGFPLSSAGLLLGLPALVGLLVVGPGGTLIDRIGARPVQVLTISLMVVADILLAFASTVQVAAVALVLNGFGMGMSWPAWQSLVATVIPPRLRQRYFGLNFTLLNLGIGIGGGVGGVFVDVARPWTFQALYLVDAASFLPVLVLLLGPLRHVAGRPELHAEEADSPIGYLAVLRRPGVGVLTVLGFAASFVGYAQLNAGMPAYARAIGDVTTEGLGLAFAANTFVIVAVQLVVLQHIEGRRRTRVIAVMGALWSLAWVSLGLSGLVPGTVGATLLVAACAAMFGLGETLLQPTIPALVNDLAPDHLRGRYNAVSSAAFQLAAVAGPVVSGALIGRGLGSAYVALLVLGSVAVGAYAVLVVEPRLPTGVNGVPAATRAAST